jgi:hypothetical protein
LGNGLKIKAQENCSGACKDLTKTHLGSLQTSADVARLHTT